MTHGEIESVVVGTLCGLSLSEGSKEECNRLIVALRYDRRSHGSTEHIPILVPLVRPPPAAGKERSNASAEQDAVIAFDERLLADDGELVTPILSALTPYDLGRTAALSRREGSWRERRTQQNEATSTTPHSSRTNLDVRAASSKAEAGFPRPGQLE